eukprot:scaffold1708_cov117-Isochrysis_galbana.AAC.13
MGEYIGVSVGGIARGACAAYLRISNSNTLQTKNIYEKTLHLVAPPYHSGTSRKCPAARVLREFRVRDRWQARPGIALECRYGTAAGIMPHANAPMPHTLTKA